MTSFASQSKDQLNEENADENKYIIFCLNEELYGTRLLEVREVVEPMPIKTVPNTVSYFEGVCNLRGQIIGVISLKSRFGIDKDTDAQNIMFVFDTESGAIAATVDKIMTVTAVPPTDIERNPNIVSNIPQRFISGIAKVNDRLVTLIDLRQILSSEELIQLEQSKMRLKAS
jgi:purine-binding chemotaxis protein CheW